MALLDELHRRRRHASVPALLETALRRDADPRGAHRLAPRRGPDRQPREGGGARPRGRLARGADAARLRQPARGPDRERARGARPALDPAGRPRHRARALDPQGQGAGGADRGALRHRRPRLLADHHRAAVGRGPDRDRLPRRLPAARLGRAGAARGEEGPGGVAAPAVRGLHPRARPADRPAPAGRRRVGDFWKELVDALPPTTRRRRARGRRRDGGRSRGGRRGRELWALAGAEGGDAVAARWEAERRELVGRGSERPFAPDLRDAPRGTHRAAARRGRGRGRRAATSGASSTACSSGCPSRTWTRDAPTGCA